MRLIYAAGALAFVAGCATQRPTTVAHPAPTHADHAETPTTPTGPRTRVGYTAADVEFMQGMIGHHAQALEMVELLPARTTRRDLRLLAERIEVSQTDEIQLMRNWLLRRGEAAPSPEHDRHGAMHALMPGMLTPEQMTRLRNAKGPEFERLFLEDMIQHHSGAITMVEKLFASPGAGQESEIFRFASDIDADQRAEIARMDALLAAMP